MQYLYAQQEADSTVSHEWIQTELMRTANASQQFTADVWRMIVEKNVDTTMADHQRGLQIARLNDALAFIQTADGQRRQEQANFNHNVEQWAATQQATTEKLAADNAAIKADLAAIRKKAEELKARKPTYLQTAHRTTRPPAILEEPAVAAGGSGGTGPPPRPPKVPLAPSEPSEDGDHDDTDLYSTPGPQTRKKEKGKGKEEGENNGDDEFTPERLACMIGEGIRAAQAGAGPQPPRPEGVHAPRLKMENPSEYDGKPTTPFNTWWESVEDYLSFYPGTSEALKIAWVGTRLTGTAKAWHLHRRKITRRTGDTWGAYSEAIQTDFRDSREAANVCHAVRTRKEEKKKVMSFYLRAGGACFLYTHCEALPAPPFRFRRCAASVFARPLSSGQVPIRRGASGKVLFRHGAGRHPAVVSKHTPPRNYPHSYARFRVTIAPNFGCHPRCP